MFLYNGSHYHVTFVLYDSVTVTLALDTKTTWLGLDLDSIHHCTRRVLVTLGG